MNESSLTIVIPTFNRNRLLEDTVEILLPQLSYNVGLVILDNCSPQPVAETLGPLLTRSKTPFARIVRNSINVGGDANILRCFEYVSGDWLWTLADDDVPEVNAVSIIRSAIGRWSDADFINFYSPHPAHPVRTETFCMRGLGEFIAGADNFGSYLFIPTCVFRASAYRSRVPVGYKYIITNATHLAMTVDLLQSGGCVCQSHEVVVRHREGYHAEVGWSDLSYAAGVSLLPAIVRSARLRHSLLKFIVNDLGVRGLFRSALLICRDIDPASYGRFLYMTAVRRTFLRGLYPANSFIAMVLGLTLYIPKLTYRFLVVMWSLFFGSPRWTRKKFHSADAYTFPLATRSNRPSKDRSSK